MTAFAYVNAGRLIADCPNLCGNAELIDETEAPRFNEFVCSYCGMRARIDRDPELSEILAVLSLRPIPHTRNWAPAGHRQVKGTPFEQGQSVLDLMNENATHGI